MRVGRVVWAPLVGGRIHTCDSLLFSTSEGDGTPVSTGEK